MKYKRLFTLHFQFQPRSNVFSGTEFKWCPSERTKLLCKGLGVLIKTTNNRVDLISPFANSTGGSTSFQALPPNVKFRFFIQLKRKEVIPHLDWPKDKMTAVLARKELLYFSNTLPNTDLLSKDFPFHSSQFRERIMVGNPEKHQGYFFLQVTPAPNLSPEDFEVQGPTGPIEVDSYSPRERKIKINPVALKEGDTLSVSYNQSPDLPKDVFATIDVFFSIEKMGWGKSFVLPIPLKSDPVRYMLLTSKTTKKVTMEEILPSTVRRKPLEFFSQTIGEEVEGILAPIREVLPFDNVKIWLFESDQKVQPGHRTGPIKITSIKDQTKTEYFHAGSGNRRINMLNLISN